MPPDGGLSANLEMRAGVQFPNAFPEIQAEGFGVSWCLSLMFRECSKEKTHQGRRTGGASSPKLQRQLQAFQISFNHSFNISIVRVFIRKGAEKGCLGGSVS